MPKYVLTGIYCANVLEAREPHRAAHLAGLKQQQTDGILITIGPTADLTQVFGIYDAPDAHTVQQLVEADPYWQHQIWTSYEVKEWIQAIGGPN